MEGGSWFLFWIFFCPCTCTTFPSFLLYRPWNLKKSIRSRLRIPRLVTVSSLRKKYVTVRWDARATCLLKRSLPKSEAKVKTAVKWKWYRLRQKRLKRDRKQNIHNKIYDHTDIPRRSISSIGSRIHVVFTGFVLWIGKKCPGALCHRQINLRHLKKNRTFLEKQN